METRRERIKEHRYHPLTLLLADMESLQYSLKNRHPIGINNDEKWIPYCEQPQFKELNDVVKKYVKKYKSVVSRRRGAAYRLTDEEQRLETMKKLRLEKKEALNNGNLLIHADRELELEKLRKRKSKIWEETQNENVPVVHVFNMEQ